MTVARVSIRAELGAGDAGTVITRLSGTEPWRPRVLHGGGGWARVALVQSRASLLRADEIALEVVVGEGAALELVELGAMLAHAARGGLPARLAVSARIEDGGRLIWIGQPLIAGAGSSVFGSAEFDLRGSARMVRAESVVLGRAGQPAGSLVSHVRMSVDGAPLLDETVDTRDPSLVASPVVAGDGSMIAAVTLAGARDGGGGGAPEAMQLFGPGTAWRGVGDAISVGGAMATVAERFSGVLRDGPGAGAGHTASRDLTRVGA